MKVSRPWLILESPYSQTSPIPIEDWRPEISRYVLATIEAVYGERGPLIPISAHCILWTYHLSLAQTLKHVRPGHSARTGENVLAPYLEH